MNPIPQQLRSYLTDDPFLNQKTHKDIQISYSLKYKHSKKEISLRKNPIMLSVMLCMGATFLEENSCLVARIATFDTATLHLLTFHILEPHSSK